MLSGPGLVIGPIGSPTLRRVAPRVQVGNMSTKQTLSGNGREYPLGEFEHMVLLAILQQENNIPRSAELLELLVSKFPQKKDYWSLLMATYLTAAVDPAH